MGFSKDLRDFYDRSFMSFGRMVAKGGCCTCFLMFLFLCAMCGGLFLGDGVEKDTLKLWTEEGGRVRTEDQYSQDWREFGWDDKNHVVIWTSKNAGSNVLTNENMKAMYDYMNMVNSIVIEVENQETKKMEKWSWAGAGGNANGLSEGGYEFEGGSCDETRESCYLYWDNLKNAKETRCSQIAPDQFGNTWNYPYKPETGCAAGAFGGPGYDCTAVSFGWAVEGRPDEQHRAMCSSLYLPLDRIDAFWGFSISRFQRAVPCIRVTPLDCFVEGGFDWEIMNNLDQTSTTGIAVSGERQCGQHGFTDEFLTNPLFGNSGPTSVRAYEPFVSGNNIETYTQSIIDRQAGKLTSKGFLTPPGGDSNTLGVLDFKERPSFTTLTDQQIMDVVSSGATTSGRPGCQSVFTSKEWDLNLLFGGVTFDEQDPTRITSVAAMRSVFLTSGPDALVLMEGVDNETSALAYEEFLDIWGEKHLEYLESPEYLASGVVVDILKAEDIDDLIEEVSDGDFGLVMASYLLMTIFVMASFFSPTASKSHVFVGVVGIVMVMFATAGGMGLFLYLGFKLNIPIMQVLPFVALGLGVNDMFIFVQVHKTLPDYQAEEGDRFLASVRHIGEVCRRAGANVTLTSFCNAAGFFIGGFIPLPAIKDFAICAALVILMNWLALIVGLQAILAVEINHAMTVRQLYPFPHIPPKGEQAGMSMFDRFCANSYVPFMSNSLTRIVMMLLWAGTLLVGIYGSTQVQTGLDSKDLVPKTSLVYGFLDQQFEYFPQYASEIVVQDVDFTDENIQVALIDFMQTFEDSKLVRPNSVEYFLPTFQTFYETAACPENRRQSVLEYPTSDPLTGEAIIYVAGTNTPYTPGVTPVGQQEYSHFGCRRRPNGAIPGDDFYRAFMKWIEEVPTSPWYVEAILAGTEKFGYDETVIPAYQYTRDNGTPNSDGKTLSKGPIVYSVMRFDAIDMRENDDYVELIKTTREQIDEAVALFSTNNGLGANGEDKLKMFPNGFIFVYWEQYMNLNYYFLLTIALGITAVFVTTYIILVGLYTAFFVTLNAGVILIEIYGYQYFLDLKFSGTNAVVLIMALGVAVEFTAHLIHTFEGGSGTRIDRMAYALNAVFVPVLQGGISSFLGFSLLAFSEFEYVVKYFFGQYTMVLVVGMLNGLVYLPAMLSYAGPVAAEGGLHHDDVGAHHTAKVGV